jgi:LysR family hydrogen peroxide-inducible transcriptional activator
VLLLDDGHCLRAQALAVCREAGAEEQSDFRATSLGTLIEMVCGGAGVTLLPELALRTEARRSGLAVRPFAKPAPHRTIGLAWRASSGRGAEFALLADSLAPRSVD